MFEQTDHSVQCSLSFPCLTGNFTNLLKSLHKEIKESPIISFCFPSFSGEVISQVELPKLLLNTVHDLRKSRYFEHERNNRKYIISSVV